jgi:sarcosine oxidase
MQSFDVIVVGLGAMGSATLATLARRGLNVLGLEQFELGHHRGSSHGKSRIIRTAYYEHPAYVPLARRAFELWDVLSEEAGHQMLRRQACLNMGSETSEVVRGVLQAAQDHNLPVERLHATQLGERFPMFRLPPGTVGVLEHQAGVLAVEQGVLAQLYLAQQTGNATLSPQTEMLGYRPVEGKIVVETTAGEFQCGQLIVTAGAWTRSILKDAGLPLTVMRQVQHWFRKPSGAGDLPIFLIETEQAAFYGLAESPIEHGWKISRHYGAPELQHPGEVNWTVTDADVGPLKEFLNQYLPTVDPLPLSSQVCQYTLTPSRDFLIDRVPDQPNITVACGFSGHGYKFAPVVGELLADLAAGKDSPWHAPLFRWQAHR